MPFRLSRLWIVATGCALFGLAASTNTVGAANNITATSAIAAESPVVIYVGGYTRDEGWVHGKSKGLYTFAFFPSNGTLVEKSVTPVGINPTFVRGTKLARNGNKQVLYAINECSEPSRDVAGTTTGYVVALEVTASGALKELNRVETRGPGPAHVSVSSNQDFVAVSTYGGGGVVLYPIKKDGSIGAPSDVHTYANGRLHSTTWVPGSNVVLAADLGNNQIVQYTLDSRAKKLVNLTLPIVKRPIGSGPRHMAIHPSGNIAYVVDETANTIGVYLLNVNDKSLSPQASQRISTLPSGATVWSSSADIHVSSDGNFVYSSNRGHNSIAMFRVTSKITGALELIGNEPTRGLTPRSFLVYKSYLIVANQDTDTLVVFRRNADGTLAYSGITAASPTPVSLFIATS